MTSNGATTTAGEATTGGTATATSSANPKSLRVMAGIGIPLTLPVWFVCLMLTLVDAHQGKGSGGPLIDAGFALLWPAVFIGAFALLLPNRSVLPRTRALFVIAQYALLLLAPLLILLDGDA
ncbi:hypothetical protein [Streptomyces mesophilus]|uniref:hypothetical protein n=1 Tax=Streptomyces mesophilus TaxID=1775132 RepID=UPI00332BC4F7